MAQPPAGGPSPATRPPLVLAAGVLLIGALPIWALIGIALGAVAIYAGVQVMNLREQGRMLGLIIAGVAGVFALINVFQGAALAIIGLLLYGFVIFVLVTQTAEFR